ncbi:PLP-dependent aminotransferase family protein [Deinococcus lacus]|uniref:PLP-dependent aminotransferase family protein n=1 Tax=Deinococcus lacus TaxID=392561 RepID=A0ABW1YEY9_9DEIO
MTSLSHPDLAGALSGRARQMTASTIREVLKLTQQPDIISFAGGLPAAELLPVEAVREATGAVLDRYGSAALQYGATEGHVPLRQWIADRAGITPAHVQIVTGSQQGLDLLGKILIDEGDTVLVESPTYLGALQSFQPYGPRYVQMPTDDDGIDVDALAEMLQHTRAKLLYAIPNFQNPTGRTLSLERRRRLVELTAEHGILVLEDDPYGELRFRGEALPSLYALALEMGLTPDTSHIIYSGSFSKVLAPGLRDAWVQAAPPITEKLVQAKQGADLHTPTLNQMIITELLPTLRQQIARTVGLYRERADVMVRAMQAAFPADVRYTTPEGGMFLWVTLPSADVDTTALMVRAVERKVAYVPGAAFYALGGGHNTMRLNFTAASPEKIVQGIEALAATIREAGESGAAASTPVVV